MKALLCSECFQNYGVRLEAFGVGIKSSLICPSCKSTNGRKLERRHLQKLIGRFFELGTVPHGVGGYASILDYRPSLDVDEVEFDAKTAHDWKLIKQHTGGALFFRGPPLWRVGITEHYDEPNVVSDETIVDIVDKLSIKILPKGTKTFRIRKNVPPAVVMNPPQYELPPANPVREHGRFDDANLQILYTSPSLPVCLHECRTVITDDIIVATFEAMADLRVADFTADYNQSSVSPYESLRYFFNGIFLTRDASVYDIARRIASCVRQRLNVDGFITDSFFTTVGQEPVSQNFCFFPSALTDQKLGLHSLNRLHLETVSYSYVLGPNFSTDQPIP
jgi:RES domain